MCGKPEYCVAAEPKLPLVLSESNEMVDELGMSRPSISLPTEVARSSGSGCSSVSPVSCTSSWTPCGGEVTLAVEPPRSSWANDFSNKDLCSGDNRSSGGESNDKSPSWFRILFAEYDSVICSVWRLVYVDTGIPRLDKEWRVTGQKTDVANAKGRQ